MSTPRRILLPLVAATLLVPSLAAQGGGQDKQDVTTCLVRPADPVDADAKGTLRLRSDEKQGQPRHRIDLATKKVDTAVEHVLWVEDGEPVPAFLEIGPLAKSGGTLKFKLDTSKGDELTAFGPGVDELSDLAGRAVEVRAGTDVVLRGVMPAFVAKGKPDKGQAKLDASAGSPDDDAKGDIKLMSKPWKCDDSIEMKVQKLDFSEGPFAVRLEQTVDGGDFIHVGEIDQLGKSSNGRWRVRTKQGDALPLGAASVADLEGLLLQVGVQVDELTFTSYLEVEIPQVK